LVIRRGRCPDSGDETLLVQFITRRRADAQLRHIAATLAREVPEVRGVVASTAPRKGGGAKTEGPPVVLHGVAIIMETLLGLWFEVLYPHSPFKRHLLILLHPDVHTL
jgi:hypothetical protein